MKRDEEKCLKERGVAELACAAHNLEESSRFRIVGRPNAPETHDFDAEDEQASRMLAIEVTQLLGTGSDDGILDPEKNSFWRELTDEIQSDLEGNVPGTFFVGGHWSEVPKIPGKTKRIVREALVEAIKRATDKSVLGHPTPLLFPTRAGTKLELVKESDEGSKVVFTSMPGGRADPGTALAQFCSTTLAKKNTGCMGQAKSNGKDTALAVDLGYLPAIKASFVKMVRCLFQSGRLHNIDYLYLVSRWSGPGTERDRVIRVFP